LKSSAEDLEKKESYFLNFDVRECLKFNLERSVIGKNLLKRLLQRNNRRQNIYEDIFDGDAYKELGKYCSSFQYSKVKAYSIRLFMLKVCKTKISHVA